MYNIHFILIYNAVRMFNTECISFFCILKIIKMLIKILSFSTLICLVAFCCLLCILEIYACTVSGCAWVRNSVEILHLAQLWISTAISNTSHSNKASSTITKRACSLVKDQGQRHCCRTKPKKLPCWPACDVSLISRHRCILSF
jgi:hypothetical protein